jgi:hypothetical protein
MQQTVESREAGEEEVANFIVQCCLRRMTCKFANLDVTDDRVAGIKLQFIVSGNESVWLVAVSARFVYLLKREIDEETERVELVAP